MPVMILDKILIPKSKKPIREFKYILQPILPIIKSGPALLVKINNKLASLAEIFFSSLNADIILAPTG